MDHTKRLASKRRYRQSAKGKKTIASHMKRYRKTRASKNALQRNYQKRQRSVELKARWKSNFKRWLLTKKGRAYCKRHNLKLPSRIPQSFLELLNLFSKLKQEVANEHN